MNLWKVLIATFGLSVFGYSTGYDSCINVPNHGSWAPGCTTNLCTTSTYAITAVNVNNIRTNGKYVPDTNYTISFGPAAGGGTAFRGFIMTVGKGFIPNDTFTQVATNGAGVLHPSGANVRAMASCTNGITHVSNTNKNVVHGTWTAPPVGTGPITFKGILVTTQAGLNYNAQLTLDEQTPTPSSTTIAAVPTFSTTRTPAPITVTVTRTVSSSRSMTVSQSVTSSHSITSTPSIVSSTHSITSTPSVATSTEPSTQSSVTSTPSLAPSTESLTLSPSPSVSPTPSVVESPTPSVVESPTPSVAESPFPSPSTVESPIGGLNSSAIDAIPNSNIQPLTTFGIVIGSVACALIISLGIVAVTKKNYKRRSMSSANTPVVDAYGGTADVVKVNPVESVSYIDHIMNRRLAIKKEFDPVKSIV